jgi:chromosomal replication initiator protein
LESAREIWERALGELQIQISKANYSTWLKSSQGISYKDDVFLVGVPNTFIAEWLSKHLYPLARKTLTDIIGKNVNVQFIVQQVQPQVSPLTYATQNDGGTSSKIKIDKFNPRYTFNNFIVGDCNRLAYAAAVGAAESTGKHYNPLFLYSDAGQGKTHLLHAIGHAAINNGLKAAYTSSEQFTSEFVQAIRQKEIEHFRDKFRNIHIFLFDDFQFISDKKQTLQCFLATFNELHNNNCQIVIVADRAPKDMTSLSKRMTSRFEWGLVVPIQPPDFETRLAILRAKAGTKITPELDQALYLIAKRVHENVRQLEGTLAYLSAQAELAGVNLTPQIVDKLLTCKSWQQGNLIVETAANYFNLPTEELIGKKRNRTAALARQITMYLMRGEDYSFTEIGKILGNRNHTTVLHGYKKIASEMNINHKLYNQVMEIKEKVDLAKVFAKK